MEFSNKFDVEQIFANRFDFNDGIYVNREYSKETERNRRLLCPILQAAKKLPEYKDVCRMEADVLNLNGTKFNKDNLHELPAKLNIMEIATKSNADVVGFFGEICPLSNFYPSKFLHNGIEFHSSEQFIQHAKATFFGDLYTQTTVLNAETVLGAKVQDGKYPIMIIKGGVDLPRTSASQVLMLSFAKTLGLCKHYWKREIKCLLSVPRMPSGAMATRSATQTVFEAKHGNPKVSWARYSRKLEIIT